MIRVAGEPRVTHVDTHRLESIRKGHRSFAVGFDSQWEVGQAHGDLIGPARIERRPQQHEGTGVKIKELVDERLLAAYDTSNQIAGPVDELREAMHDDVGAMEFGCHGDGRKGVVHDQPSTVPMGNLR